MVSVEVKPESDGDSRHTGCQRRIKRDKMGIASDGSKCERASGACTPRVQTEGLHHHLHSLRRVVVRVLQGGHMRKNLACRHEGVEGRLDPDIDMVRPAVLQMDVARRSTLDLVLNDDRIQHG